MILTILAIWWGYKKARSSGRNPYLWAAICGGTFIGVQFLAAIGFAVAIGIGQEFWGWRESLYEDLTWLVYIVSIGASFISLFLIFRYLDKVPEQDLPMDPPPPPNFDRSE